VLINIATILDAGADRVWRLIKKPSTFLFVVRGVLGVSGGKNWPETWREGEMVTTRLWPFHIVPAWRHQLRVISVSDTERTMKTVEHGGPLRKWDHTLRVEPIAENRSRYTDRLQIEAGMLNWVAWPLVQAFFRYRQMRLRIRVRR
jgi:hypothetical protein